MFGNQTSSTSDWSASYDSLQKLLTVTTKYSPFSSGSGVDISSLIKVQLKLDSSLTQSSLVSVSRTESSNSYANTIDSNLNLNVISKTLTSGNRNKSKKIFQISLPEHG